jgi:hypothetical protein
MVAAGVIGAEAVAEPNSSKRRWTYFPDVPVPSSAILTTRPPPPARRRERDMAAGNGPPAAVMRWAAAAQAMFLVARSS